MDIQKIIDDLRDCPCGREHTTDLRCVEIGSGLKEKTAEILTKNGFPKNILVVADENTLKASDGILEILSAGGFTYKTKIYEDLRVADMVDVNFLVEYCQDTDGILSVGTGSLNDICRLAAYRADKAFAIFATAPSMDGFASGTSPITENNFKLTRQARQPSIIIGDTKILAAAPAELKAAGFGDIIGKLIGIVDWKVSNLTTGEYYCDAVAKLALQAVDKVVSMADNVSAEDEASAQAIMEALIITGIAMKLAGTVRPASGDEHILAHYWEIKKLEKGHISDFHGKKVGVATLYITKLYKELCAKADMEFHDEVLDWDEVYRTYGPNFEEDVRSLNSPTVTTETDAARVKAAWPEICRIVNEELPTVEALYDTMRRATAATTVKEISVSRELGVEGLIFHPYMRHRMTLTRLVPMMDYTVDWDSIIEKE